MPNYYLRQWASTVGLAPTTSPYEIAPAVLPQGMLGTANSRLIAMMAVFGPGHAQNQANINHNRNFPVDTGNPGDGTNQVSIDVLFADEQAGDAGTTDIYFGLTGSYSNSYIAAFVGEWTEMDQSSYNSYNASQPPAYLGDYDSSFAWTGTAQNVTLSRVGSGNNSNSAPELLIWGIAGSGVVTINGQSFNPRALVTDNANIWMAVQDTYVNQTGTTDATWTLSRSSYYVATNASYKTLAYPLGAGKPRVDLSGFGTPTPGIRL